MLNNYEFASFLIASWRLAAGTRRLPTSDGILDRALDKCSSSLPGRFESQLHFVDTVVGKQCRDLPYILRAAQESYLTSEPNPTYLTSQIKIDEPEAYRLLIGLELDLKDGEVFGDALVMAVDSEISALKACLAVA